MLTLIKLIHTLNRRIDFVSNRLKADRFVKGFGQENHQSKIRFQAICAVIALSLAGLGRVEVAQAKSLDFAGIRQSLELTANNQLRAERGISIKSKFLAQNINQNINQNISQNIALTPPAPSPNNSKLTNDLNLPKTGGEVQITGNKSITLQETLDTAFRNNRDIQSARLTVDRNLAGVRSAQAAQAVQVGLTSSFQGQGSPLIIGVKQSPLTNSSDTSLQGRLQATYSLSDAGRNQGSVRAAEEQVKFARLDLIRIEQTVRGNVTTAYYDLQQADSSVIINQAAVKDAARSLSDAQLQEKAGVGTKFDILRAEVQLANANQNLVNAQGQQQIARKKIAQLLVVDNSTEFTAADTVRESGLWNYSLEDSVVLAFKNRPEVKQQLVLRNASQQQQIVAAAADSAQVNLFANYNLNKSLTTSVPAQDNYSAGLQLSWNFWDGGAASAGVDREKVNQEIYENQFTTSRNQIRFEVEQSYYNLGTSKKNIATSTKALQQAEESLKLARLRFQAGVGTQTDVIQAQTELATARGNRITAILNYNRALSSLRIATVL